MNLMNVYVSLASLLLFSALTGEGDAVCFHRERKSINIREKLEENLVSPPFQPPSAAPQAPNKIGRVFYPIAYGADPTGTKDSSDAIVEALQDASRLESGLELLPGIKDLRGVVIDLQGGNYTISKPITFPPDIGNIVVHGGTLRASETFPGDRHLVELWSASSKKQQKTPPVAVDIPRDFSDGKGQSGRMYYDDITFRDILFDSGFRGGGIFIVDSARIRIHNCFFLHFTTEGILVQGGHETFISSSFLGQHSTVGGDRDEPSFTGTAIDLASNDNAITDATIFSASIGIVLRGEANIITGVHCYNKATGFGGIGIQIKLAGNSKTRIDNCYLDYTGIVMEDPVQVHVTNGFFLGDANIVLKSIKGQVSGLNIVNNMFSGSGDPNSLVPIVKLDGEFSEIDQVVIEKNNVVGMRLKSTVAKLTVDGNGSKWVADFSTVLLFPNRITYFQYSLFTRAGDGDSKFVAHSVTNISNNVLVVETETAVKGLVSIVAEQ